MASAALAEEITFSEPTPYVVDEGNPFALTSADFDGVRGPDLATSTAGTMAIFLNNGDGTFRRFGGQDLVANPIDILGVDVDGVNGPDIAVTDFGNPSVSVLRNMGGAVFDEPDTYVIGTSLVEGIASADFDGANGPDLAATSVSFSTPENNFVAVLFNNGDGTFRPPVFYPLDLLGPHNLTSADLDNRDGPDLAVTNRDDRTVSVFLNRGDGTFNAPVRFSAPDAPIRIVAGDLDGCCGPDLVTTNFFSSVGVLLNRGQGSFAPSVTYDVAVFGSGVDLADFDMDGDFDVVASQSDGSSVSILANHGDGTFSSAQNVESGASTGSILAVDVDRADGPDIVAANSTSQTVSVLLNETNRILVDVRPGDAINVVNPQLGVIPVAILTTTTSDGERANFDALEVDPVTARFGRAGATVGMSSRNTQAVDVDEDGDLDLRLRFRARDSGIVCADTTADLHAETFSGRVVKGSDAVRPLFCEFDGTVRIKAHIDGRSQLRLSGNSAQWHHFDFAAPGRHEFMNEPTVINNVQWFPVWPDIPDAENRFCNCLSDVFEGVAPPLPTAELVEKISLVQSRGDTFVVQSPSAENGNTLIIEFDDNPIGGSDDYVIDVHYSRLP